MNPKNIMTIKPILIQTCLLLLLLPVASQAQQIFQYPTDNGYYDYTTNNGAVAIKDYQGDDDVLTIPDNISGLPVKSVGSDAFFQSESLTSVTLGTNVTTLADNAFFQCYILASVSIPASITNIGTGPFFDCQSLITISVNPANSYYTNVNQLLFNKTQTSLIQFPGGIGGGYILPAAVTNIGAAFVGNTLTNISVNTANTIFSSTNGVLFNKNKTQLISYPGLATADVTIGYTIPGTVTTIVSGAFEYTASVTNVTIGTNVTSIGYVAFYDCANLAAITVNLTNLFYSSTNGVLFDKNKTMLIQYPIAVAGSYAIPGTVTNLADGAFGDALSLTGVVIPNSVTNIGFETFYNCPSLANVTIGNHVANIGASAFFLCTNLAAVVIPASVTNIAQYAFGACESLSSVCFDGKPPADGGNVFFEDNTYYSLSTILYINGTVGWSSTYDGIATTPCPTCGDSLPQLAISRSGTNVILTWSTDFSAFTLQSTTNLVPANWGTVTPAASVVNGLETVTNAISSTWKFYRLSQ
jgi:BspA type Leucine rich repeat region (6 copies)